jgi:transcriptional regulator with XRE-family HTH domain
VPRRIQVPQSGETFGKRLARIRTAAGYTQQELAQEIGISPRMVAYYEVQTDQPPAALLPVIARALRVTSDELLGLKPFRASRTFSDSRLWRRFKQVEKLPARERRQVIQFIDTVLERDRLRKQVPA